jgi:hypothetical protein
MLSIQALIIVLAIFLAPPLAAFASLIATLLILGRYLAMGAFAGGIARRAWLLPLSIWIAFFGLLALLLFLSGRKGVILWPAAVTLVGPAVFFGLSLVGASSCFRAPRGPALPGGGR